MRVKGPFSMEHMERGSHARDVYPTHVVYLVHGNCYGEARERSRHKNNSNRVTRNLEVKNVHGNENE